jgi:hypothetical protein
MSTEQDRFHHSQRLHRDDTAVARQVKIAQEHGMAVDEPHRLVKHHAMDCGNPTCPTCGNPRRTHKHTLTAQEQRLFQDTDQPRDRHSNGFPMRDQEQDK